MPHFTLILFVLALAAGLAGITLFHELHGRHGRAYLRAGRTQLILFNLIILFQLLHSYYILNLSSGDFSAPATIHIIHMAASIVLKLVWVTAFGVMAAGLLGFTVSRSARIVGRVAAGSLVAVFVAMAVHARRSPVGMGALSSTQAAVEAIVVAGVGVICAGLLFGFRRAGGKSERQMVRSVGWLMVAIWAPVLFSLTLGRRLWPGSLDVRLFAHAFLILMFNIAPPLLIRRRLVGLPVFAEGREPDWERLIDAYGITPREREILELICAGKRNREMAETLHISLQTVKDHNYRIYRKLGVKTRVQAANLVRGDSTSPI